MPKTPRLIAHRKQLQVYGHGLRVTANGFPRCQCGEYGPATKDLERTVEWHRKHKLGVLKDEGR